MVGVSKVSWVELLGSTWPVTTWLSGGTENGHDPVQKRVLGRGWSVGSVGTLFGCGLKQLCCQAVLPRWGSQYKSGHWGLVGLWYEVLIGRCGLGQPCCQMARQW